MNMNERLNEFAINHHAAYLTLCCATGLAIGLAFRLLYDTTIGRKL